MSACCCLVTESCLTLCDPTDCSPPGSYVHGIAISSSRGSSGPRDRSCILRLLHWQAGSLPLSHQGAQLSTYHSLILRAFMFRPEKKEKSVSIKFSLSVSLTFLNGCGCPVMTLKSQNHQFLILAPFPQHSLQDHTE